MTSTSKIVRFTFPVRNLWIQHEFNFDGHRFTPVQDYEDAIFRLINRESDELTVTVTYEDDGSRPSPSVLWEHGRALDDYLTLLSVAQGRHIHYPVAQWVQLQGDCTTASGAIPAQGRVMPARGERALTPWETEPFLTIAQSVIQQPGWAEGSGFREATTWYLESISTHLPEQRFLSAYEGLEALVRSFLSEEKLSSIGAPVSLPRGPSPADAPRAIEALGQHRQWGWITPALGEIWSEIALDLAVHTRGERLFGPRYVYEFAGRLQLALLLGLLDMVGMHEFARRERIQRLIARRLAGWQ